MVKKALQQAIELRGPLSIANYMKQCLTDPKDGYYMKQDPFGAKGDFVTSPEISQMFGELVGINVLMQWMSQGEPEKVRLVELGPGRGTLMDDMLRAAKTFPKFFNAVQEVQLVEASPTLRELQKQKLDKYGIKTDWFDLTREVPKDKVATYIVAHEFFDALPVHQFEKTKLGWQERLVAFNKDKDEFGTVLGPANSLIAQTIASQPRYKNLPETSEIEVSPESWDVAKEIAEIIAINGGGALIMDYGPMATIPIKTFRGFKDHKQVDPFEHPGDADLTADVDFRALADIFNKFAKLRVFGPTKQADWLHRMGIGARATVLANAQKDEDGVKRISDAYNRLVDPEFMGKTYKIMAVLNGGTAEGFTAPKL